MYSTFSYLYNGSDILTLLSTFYRLRNKVQRVNKLGKITQLESIQQSRNLNAGHLNLAVIKFFTVLRLKLLMWIHFTHRSLSQASKIRQKHIKLLLCVSHRHCPRYWENKPDTNCPDGPYNLETVFQYLSLQTVCSTLIRFLIIFLSLILIA